MIRYFKCSNIKSIRDEAFLDFTGKNISDNNEQITKIGRESILNVVAIYGINSSGKTSIYDAFEIMVHYINNSFGFDIEEDDKMPYIPVYKFESEYEDKPTSFEVSMAIPLQKDKNRKIFRYGFTIHDNKIIKEYLDIKSLTAKEFKNVFTREGLSIKSDDISIKNLEAPLTEYNLLLTLGAKWKINQFISIREWFQKCKSISYGELIESVFVESQIPKCLFNENYDEKQKLIKFMRIFDKNIDNIYAEEVTINENRKNYRIYVEHLDNKGNKFTLNIVELSAGSKKMFSLFQNILAALENGSVLFIDELNAKMHPFLLKLIIDIFKKQNINTNGAQLIFTSHESWVLADKQLSRDSIYIVEREGYYSTIKSLYDCFDKNGNRVRKDANYLEFYLKTKSGDELQLDESIFI